MKMKLGDRYNYIDILLYNIIFKCFIVIELKVTELRKEYIGQIEIYMNYIDNNIKRYDDNKTIGIVICKKDNKYIIEYCSDKRILSREYKLYIIFFVKLYVKFNFYLRLNIKNMLYLNKL